MRNSIIALTSPRPLAGGGPDLLGDFISHGHNIIGDESGTTGFTEGVDGDLVGTAAAIDPKIGPLQNNGGPTRTHALLAGSPAIDAGDNDVPMKKDQRAPRPIPPPQGRRRQWQSQSRYWRFRAVDDSAINATLSL